ncbi:MAG: hypothetical protein HOQ12_01835 [Gemmatimonadaceae bacterium]|nr:hypothetical protein [Gemmatimonadaceae bacterium]NUQ94984.1 hypothetical protein [Gemmatimonadaceae bacterium]NUR18253.1 hypothetical protein [Gemmatimonadaceae bacterium]
MNRRPLALAIAVAALSVLAGCNLDAGAPDTAWHWRPCDQARVDLATTWGRSPDKTITDADDPRIQTLEHDLYFTSIAKGDSVKTDDFGFNWSSGSCATTHTTTTAAK